jgi:hypothetical protein
VTLSASYVDELQQNCVRNLISNFSIGKNLRECVNIEGNPEHIFSESLRYSLNF